jgi:putative transposase
VKTLDGKIAEFAPKVGIARACKAFGVNERTWRRRRQHAAGRAAVRPSRATGRPPRPHPAALSDAEIDQIVETLCSERFCDLAPAQVYATLLDEGTYLCSERHMYRILTQRGLVRERRRGGHQRAGTYGVPRLEADAPNRVWTWDITALSGPAKGVKYYLYTIVDIFSRKVVGWTIHPNESEQHARRLIREACRRHRIDRDQLVIHADRGSPMVAGTVAELLNELGVTKSHSRPRVSNDNPFIESHFKTLKYRPDYPDRFDSITAARTWMRSFVHWYNHIHYHSGIGYLHPADLHTGDHTAIVEHRQTVLDAAAAAHPERFTRRPTPAPTPTKAWINKPTIQPA